MFLEVRGKIQDDTWVFWRGRGYAHFCTIYVSWLNNTCTVQTVFNGS